MKKLRIFAAAAAVAALATPAFGADFKFSGDLDHRFNLYTNQATMYSKGETVGTLAAPGAVIDKDDREEFWGDIKYRLSVEALTNDGKVKGVYGIEVGAVRFGREGSSGRSVGGAYSGDGVNVETRFAYTDLMVDGKTRLIAGLQPFTVNKYVWKETAAGVQLKSKVGGADLTAAWMRGKELFNNDSDDDLFADADGFLLRSDFKPTKDAKLGAFALYQRSSPGEDAGAPTVSHLLKNFSDVEYDLYTLGVDGGLTIPTGFGNVFANWDAIYQTGSAKDPRAAAVFDVDVRGYFLHTDLGANMGKARFTYTGWYASGDDDATDGRIENFIATDVDMADSIIFFEGGYTNDNFFTEAPYILNKGLIFNKLAVDYKATQKLSVGSALLYLMTAEDLTLADGSKEKKLGTEIDAYISYQLYPNVEVALNAGYLFAGDGMDFFEIPAQQDGKADTDIYRTTMRIRYRF